MTKRRRMAHIIKSWPPDFRGPPPPGIVRTYQRIAKPSDWVPTWSGSPPFTNDQFKYSRTNASRRTMPGHLPINPA